MQMGGLGSKGRKNKEGQGSSLTNSSRPAVSRLLKCSPIMRKTVERIHS